MKTATRRRRVFVSGQLVEYWEHPDVTFGWTRQHLQTYVERGGTGCSCSTLSSSPAPPEDRARVVSGG